MSVYCLYSQSAFHPCDGHRVSMASSRAKKKRSAIIRVSMCPLIHCSAYSLVCNNMHYLIKWANTFVLRKSVHLQVKCKMQNPINFWRQFVCIIGFGAFWKLALVIMVIQKYYPVFTLILRAYFCLKKLPFIFLLGNVCSLYWIITGYLWVLVNFSCQ